MESFPIKMCLKYGVWIERTLRRYGKKVLDGELSHKLVSEIRGNDRVDTAALWEEGAGWGDFP